MPLQIIRQDITKMKVDAIVNTTNRDMIGYSGVDMAVHAAAGKELDAECALLAPIKKGTATVTSGYNLGSKYIIHTCGPLWEGGGSREREMLESCYISCLLAALDLGCETIAFPLISSGAYGFPKDDVLKLAISIITEFLFDHEITVYLCVFDRKSYWFSQKLFADISEYIDDEYVDMSEDIFLRTSQAPYESTRRNKTKKSDFIRQRPKADDEIPETVTFNSAMPDDCMSASSAAFESCENLVGLDDLLKSMDKGFADTLFSYIDKKGMTDVECYKKANVDKKTFSKIKCNKDYRPSKQTALAFAIALNLSLEETGHLLNTVGMSLSHSNKFDVIIKYFIVNGNYNIFEINEALFEFDQMLLGC